MLIGEELCASKENRFINFIIDTIVLIILNTCFIVFIGFILLLRGADINILIFALKIGYYDSTIRILSVVSFFIFYLLSEVFLKGRTIGKIATNTIVVDKNGNIPSFIAILKRSLIRLIPLYWISFWGLKSRGWHDIASGTYVVDKSKLAIIKSKKAID